MNSPRKQGLVSDPLPLKGSLGKWLIPGVGQGIYKMSLENLMVPEEKNVLKEHSDGGHDRRAAGLTWKGSQWPRVKKIKQQNT